MVEEAAKFSDVHDDISKFEHGYKTIGGERGVTLSGGQNNVFPLQEPSHKEC